MLTLLLLPQFVWGELRIRKIAEIDKTGQVSPDGEHLSYMDPNTGGLGLLNLRTLERRFLPIPIGRNLFSFRLSRQTAGGSRPLQQ